MYKKNINFISSLKAGKMLSFLDIIKSLVFVLVIFLIIPQSYSIDTSSNFTTDDILSTQSMLAEINISSTIEFTKLSSDSRLDKVEIIQSFFPKFTPNQRILALQTSPKSEINTSVIKYEWNNPTFNEMPFSLYSKVKVENNFVPVNKKIKFPIINLDPDLTQYTLPQINIDSNNRDIIEKANELVSGEDDLYVAVFNIANYVEQNIKYSLDTSTSDVSQKASWVIKNKEGVCDELSSLFIAMVRSLGIPARYISGVAYTNWNDLNDFGPHAWAEVYFPGYGWVPFDVTYGEFGFIDSSHIKLKESLDSNEPSANYHWEGWMVELNTHRLNMDTKIISIDPKVESKIKLNVIPLKSSVGFGSYNLIEIEAINPTSYYVPAEISISRSTNMQTFGKERKQILIEPNSTKKSYWIIKIDENLDPNYVYTFKVSADSTYSERSENAFTSSNEDEKFDLDYIQNQLKIKTEEKLKTYSKNLNLSCYTDKKEFYTDEIIKLTCNVKNYGNALLKNLKVCYKNDCKTLNLGITEESKIYFALNFSNPGQKSLDIIATNSEVSKESNLGIIILDKPNITISDIKAPQNIEFGKSYQFEFMLNKISFSSPMNASINLISPLGTKSWQIDKVEENRKFYINFNSGELTDKSNQFEITIKYFNNYGQEFVTKQSYSINLTNLTWLDEQKLTYNKLNGKLSSMDTKLLIFLIFISLLIFGLIIMLIFSHKKGIKELELEIEAEGESKSVADKELKEEEKIEKAIRKSN